MNDETTPSADEQQDASAPAEAAGTAQAATPPAWKARVRKWLIIGGIGAVLIPGIVLTAWAWITLHWTYSTGDRAGFVQKISEKGWICPTWEGELSMVNLPGAAPEVWSFTVRDEIVANAVRNSMGHKVALEYEE